MLSALVGLACSRLRPRCAALSEIADLKHWHQCQYMAQQLDSRIRAGLILAALIFIKSVAYEEVDKVTRKLSSLSK